MQDIHIYKVLPSTDRKDKHLITFQFPIFIIIIGIRPQLIFNTFSIHTSYSILASRKFHNSPGTKQMTDSNSLKTSSILRQKY